MNSYKLRKYLFNLLTLLFLGINTSWAQEYGACLLQFKDVPQDARSAFFALDQPERGAIIEWQMINALGNWGEGFATRLINAASFITGEPKFTEEVNQKLTSFAGIYRRPGSEYAIRYKFYMTNVGTNGYDWILAVSPAYRPEKDPTPTTFTAIPMLCRVDYAFPGVLRTTFYSAATEIPEHELAVLNAHLDKITNLNKLTLNTITKSSTDTATSEASSSDVPTFNANMYFCGFDVNNEKEKTSAIHYIAWYTYEMPEYGSRTYGIKPFKIKVAKYNTGLLETITLENVPLKNMPANTTLAFKKPEQDMARIGDDMQTIEKRVKIPKELEKSPGKELWYVSGTYKSTKINKTPVLCRKTQFFLDVENLSVTNPTFDIIRPQVENSWPTEEKKEN